VLPGVSQDHAQEPLGTVRGTPALDPLIKQASRDILNGAKHFVAFALATGFDRGVLPAPRPRVAQRAPLGKTGRILKKPQALLSLGSAQHPRPFLLEPVLAPCGVEMIRHQAGLVKRNPQVGQQRTHILAVVEHTKLPPDQPPDEPGGPTGRLTAHDQWTGLNQLAQAFLLLGSQLLGAPSTMAGDHAVQAVEEKGPLPVVETGGTAAPALAPHRHGHMVHQQVDQHRRPPHQTHIVFEGSLVQPRVQGFDSRSTGLYSDAHGGILLFREDRNVYGEIPPFAQGRQS